MKKLIICILPLVIALTSCEKFLDQQPISSLSNDLFWKTSEDARLGNAAIYDALQKHLQTVISTGVMRVLIISPIVALVIIKSW